MANRNLANRILALVFVAFIAIVAVKYYHRDSLLIKLVYTVLEAALVGGVADWFAVTALFSRPLGIPWHTALIPRNRQRIVDGIVGMVQGELLSKQVVYNRLANVRLVELFIKWVDCHGGKAILGNMIAEYVRDVIASIESPNVVPKLEITLKKYLRTVDITPSLRSLGRWAMDTGRQEEFVDFLLEVAARQAQRPETKEYIRAYLEKYADDAADNFLKKFFKSILQSVDAINTEEAAAALQTELVTEINNMRARDHALRVWIHRQLEQLIDSLEYDSAVRETIASWQAEVLERVELRSVLTQLLELVIRSAGELEQADQAGNKPPLTIWVGEQVDRYWGLFKENVGLQDWIERYLREALFHLVEKEHYLVGVITRRSLDILTEDNLNEFIQEKAGDDLQWIRINGSVVGGVVGFLIFLIQQFVYQPIILRL